MKNLKVIQFLSTLNAEEFERFDKYIRSPYFNTHQGTIALFHLLKVHYPNFPEDKIAKEKIFAQLFPEQPFDEKKIYNMGNFLHKHLVEFMAFYVNQKEKDLWEPVFTIASLESHNLTSQVPKYIKDADQRFSQYSFRDDTYFYYQYLLWEQKCNYILSQNNRATDVPFQSILDQLDYFVLLVKMSIAIPLASRKSILVEDESISIIEEVITLYERLPGEKPLVVRLYYTVLQMLTQEDGRPYYHKLGELISACIPILPQAKIYPIYMYAINFCSKMIKQGESEYHHKMFDLYKQMLDSDLLFTYPTATNINFKNVVTIGLRLKKHTWVRNFIEKYRDRIDPKYQTSIINYTLASVHFAKAEYSEAKLLLADMKFLDPFYRLSNDILLLKIFYETGETDNLHFRSRAFTTYIQRNKTLAAANKEAYINLARFIRRLSRVKYDQKKNLAKIKADFKACEYLVERNWLAEKIKEL